MVTTIHILINPRFYMWYKVITLMNFTKKILLEMGAWGNSISIFILALKSGF